MFRWPSTLDASAVFSSNKTISTSQTRSSFVGELISHLRKHGFARVRNHSVTPTHIKKLFKYHRDFFNLPLPAKLSVPHIGGEAPARGYSPWAYEKTAILRPDLHAAPSFSTTTNPQPLSSRSSPPQYVSFLKETATPLPKTLLDAREQFAVGPPGDTKFPTPQLAEELLPGFNAATKAAYLEIGNTCRTLVHAIEEGLGAPKDSISSPAAGGQGAELNLNFYPEVERNVLEGSVDPRETNGGVSMRRIWPHSDLGVVSALFQDGVGASGLELEVRESPGNEFAALPIEEEGDMVLLVSDTLERWTNGYLSAAVHRVGLPPVIPGMTQVPERRSAVMFFRAPPTADLGPLPHFVSPQDPAKYEHITAEEYLKRHNRRLY